MFRRCVLACGVCLMCLFATATCSAESLFSGEDADFVIPAAVVRIEEESFAGIAAESIYIQDGMVQIEALAFSDCKNLRRIRIPATVKRIASSAFKNCPSDIKIYGKADSAAQTFAWDCGFHFYDELTGKELENNSLPEIPAL